jgi:hypothetical protein
MARILVAKDVRDSDIEQAKRTTVTVAAQQYVFILPASGVPILTGYILIFRLDPFRGSGLT